MLSPLFTLGAVYTCIEERPAPVFFTLEPVAIVCIVWMVSVGYGMHFVFTYF